MPVAIVFGGAHGLGRACAKLLSDDGFTTLTADLDGTNTERSIKCDSTRRSDVERVFSRAAEFGLINSVVTTVGNFPRYPLLEIDNEAWDFSFRGNVLSVYEVYRAAAYYWRGRNSEADPELLRVCSTSSVNAFQAHPGNAHYAAMKAAVNSLTRSFAADHARDRIFYNSIAPSGIKHERTADLPWMSELEARHPLGRAATPEDIAEIIRFLVSPRNRYITGEIVTATGGVFFRS